jgi:FkbM family methyltransferase
MRPHVGFYALLAMYQPAVICDIGSLDGTQALRFKRLCPRSTVVAFEANPRNHAAMSRDGALNRAGIVVEHKAVTAETARVRFNVVDVPADAPWVRGTSSLRARSDAGRELTSRAAIVDGVRLDDYLSSVAGSIALWIDVEGAAADVLRGAEGIMNRVQMVHVEAELEPIWIGQATAPELLRALIAMGFEEVARGHEDSAGVAAENAVQYNYLMARRSRRARVALGLARGADRLRQLGR